MRKTTIILASFLLIIGTVAATSPPENNEDSLTESIISILSNINPFSSTQLGDMQAQVSPDDTLNGETEIDASQPPWYLTTFNIAAGNDQISAGGELDYIYLSRLSDDWCSNNEGPLQIPTNLVDENGNTVETETFDYHCDLTTSVRFENVEAPDETGTYTWSIEWDFNAMDNSWTGTNQIDTESFQVTGYDNPVNVRIMPPPPDGGVENLGAGSNPNLYTDIDGNPDNIEWSTGTGETIQGEEFDYSYDTTGEYTIEVEVWNDGTDNRDTDKRDVEVNKPTIRAQFYLDSRFNRYNLGDTFTVGQELNLKSSSVGSELEKEWKGDVSGTGDSITTSFEDGGDQEITLQITDEFGQTDTSTQIVSVEHEAPEADFNIYTEEDSVSRTMPRGTATAEITEEVELDGTQSEAGTTEIVNYEWEVDGRRLTGEEAKYEPRETGRKNVKLTVRDQAGLEHSVTEEDVIEVIDPTLDVKMDAPSTGVTGESIRLSLDEDSSTINDEINRVVWDIPEQGTLTGQSVRPQFETTGNYQLEMTVIDDHGQAETDRQTIRIHEPDEKPSLLQRISIFLENLL